MTHQELITRGLRIVTEEQAAYYRTLAVEAVTLSTSAAVIAGAKSAGDRMVERITARLDELKAEATA